MSIQLQFLPTTNSAYKQQQKQTQQKVGKSQQQNFSEIGEKNITVDAAKTPTKQHQTCSVQITSSTSPSSADQQSVPLVKVPGSVKRSRPPEIDLPEMSNQDDHFANQSSVMNDRFAPPTSPFAFSSADASTLVGGPRPKQRRYEDRMSNQLGGIYISPDKEAQQNDQQRNGPKIQEIVDWDDEFLEDEGEMIRQAFFAPIVEEPRTTPSQMVDEFLEMRKDDGDGPKIEELFENGDIRYEEFFGDCNDEENDKDCSEEEQKIVLSDQLRQLIQRDRTQSVSSAQGHSPLLTRSQIRTGKELIPYVPSPLAREPSISAANSGIQKVKESSDEFFDDNEFLPDAINSRPWVEENSGELMLPTPPNIEPIVSDEDFSHRRNNNNVPPFSTYCQQIELQDEEEEAMDVD